MQQMQSERKPWSHQLTSMKVGGMIDAKTEKEVAAVRRAISRLVDKKPNLKYTTTSIGETVKVIRVK